MKPNSSIDLSDEVPIEEMLTRFKPYPSQRFYRLVAEKPWKSTRSPMYPFRVARRGFRLIFASLVSLFIIIGVLYLTPQGRAFAQEVIYFFTRSGGLTFPLSSKDMEILNYKETIVPSYTVPLSTITPSEEQSIINQTETPHHPKTVCDTEASSKSYECQIINAETIAGFKAKQLSGDPEGLSFGGATAIVNQVIRIQYDAVSAQGSQGWLFIIQGLGNFPPDGEWEAVPADKIEMVQVGPNKGEYVKGYFLPDTYTKYATWTDDEFIQRLRWREGGRWFEIRKSGAYWLEGLNREGLIAIAQRLSYSPGPYRHWLNPNYLTSVGDAEKLAGFSLEEPAKLPQGFRFSSASYEVGQSRVRLVYYIIPSFVKWGGLVIYESQLHNSSVEELLKDYAIGDIEKVQIGVDTGFYLDLPSKHPSTLLDSFTVWQPDVPQLIWSSNGFLFEMYYYPIPEYGGLVDKSEMIAIAESMH